MEGEWKSRLLQTPTHLDLRLVTRGRVESHAVDIRLRGVCVDDGSVFPRRSRATQPYLGGWVVTEEREDVHVDVHVAHPAHLQVTDETNLHVRCA